MNRKAILLIGLLISCCTHAQVAELSQEWIKSIEDKHSFQTLALENFQNLDFSPLLSNQMRMDKDPLSTYVGAFGPKYRRIDFHLELSKVGSQYQLVGKSKMDQNIRPLQGKMTLKKVLWRQWDYLSDRLYIGIFDCTLKEPGNKEGDGSYSGIFTLVLFQGEDGPEIFMTSSGDWPTLLPGALHLRRKSRSDDHKRSVSAIRLGRLSSASRRKGQVVGVGLRIW